MDPKKTPDDSIVNDIFWLNDPSILFKKHNYYRIIPSKQMGWVETLNTLSRFFIYLLIFYLIFTTNRKYLFIPIIGLIIIVLIYQTRKPERETDINKGKETFSESHYSEDLYIPQKTKDNPFGNIMLTDYENNDIYYHNNMDKFSETDNDIYTQRQFFTMPSTTIPNDQTTFAKWLYRLPETCKENQKNCLKYEDVRYKKHNPAIDTPNCSI